MKFVKLDLSFNERIKVLFFGLIAEDRLPIIEVVKEVVIEKQVYISPIHVDTQHKQSPNINSSTTEQLDIPFFDLGDKDVKSNF